MATDDRASNLFFLLTLPLAIGCATGDEDTTTSGPPVVDPTTGDDDDTGATDGAQDADASNTNPSTSGNDDGPSMTTQPAEDTADGPYVDTTGYIDTTGGYSCLDLMPPMPMGPISPGCMQYAAHGTECFYAGDPACTPINEAYCQYAIEYNVMMYGEACGAAYEELFVCLSQLTCEQLGDKVEDCPEQFMGLDTACVP